MTFSPLLQSIIDRHAYPIVDQHDAQRVAEAHEFCVLFFAGDAERLLESNDVAVVLPELDRAFEGLFQPLVVARDSERALQLVYRFNAYPALVFLRRGAYLGTIQKVQDWADYIEQIQTILTSRPGTPPPYQFPDGCNPAAAAQT